VGFAVSAQPNESEEWGIEILINPLPITDYQLPISDRYLSQLIKETIPMKNVMFVCKKNSARSQMAEGFAKTLGAGTIAVTSSGLEASQVRPEAITAMQEVGIDITDQHSKPLSDFKAEEFDVVISLCGCGVNLPPEWVTREVFDDWQLDDPAEQPEIFPRVRDEIKDRVERLIQSLQLAEVAAAESA
jgi:arsenate reductase (thioredoxin)